MRPKIHRRFFATFVVAIHVFVNLTYSATADETLTDSLGTKFRFVEGGRFIQGTSGGERRLQRAFPLSTTGQFFGNAEEPAHVTWVTKPFYIAETEVTVAQFRNFVKDTGYQTSAQQGATQMVGWEPTPEDKPLYQSYDFLRDEKFSWKHPGFEQADDHPVVGISWTDTKAYCEWLSKKDSVHYRLPTEAEWELSCRAGTTTWFSFGDQAKGVVHRFGNLGNVELEKHRRHSAERQWLLDWENSPEDGYVFTAPVGSYEGNAWGLKDMHGNVWEWCEDLWLDTVYKDFNRPKYNEPNGTAVDPVNTNRPQTPANSFHTIRGGSWYNGDLICRSANRAYWDADDAACYIGFRLVREAPADVSTTAKDAYESEVQAIERIKAAGGALSSSDGLEIAVHFEGEQFNETVLKDLQQLPDLQSLRIGWRKRDAVLTQSGLQTIAELSKLRSLEFTSSLNPNVVDLSVLTNLRELESLKFSRSIALNDQHLAAIQDFSSLLRFECYGTGGGLTDEGISRLKQNRKLTELNVWENQATGLFLHDFIGCPLSTFSCTRVYNGGAMLDEKYAVELVNFPALQALRLTGQTLLGSPTMVMIGQLTRLRELQLSECSGFTDDDFRELTGLTQLRNLNLSGTQAGDRAVKAIASIPQLQELQLGSETLTDAGMSELKNALSINRLVVRSNSVTDKGIESLGRINRLRYLTIVSDKVTGTGLGPISKLPELRDLSLITSGLQDVAFDHLSQARSVQKLRLAHRGHKPPEALTNSGLMKMSTATWLKEFWLPRNGTGITEDQIDELKKLMPKSGVIPYTVSWK